MKRVRFLQSVILSNTSSVLHLNDELDVEDKVAEKYKAQGLVDILLDDEAPVEKEKPEVKEKVKAPAKNKKVGE